MPVSPTKALREQARQLVEDDANFVKSLLYFFELRVPAEIAIPFPTRYFFPLILAPTSYSMEEPFSVEATPTQRGGLWVEEDGIVQRIIRLKGHTGFKPKPLSTDGGSSLTFNRWVERKSYSRSLSPTVLQAISGKRHFEYLQDAVFRTYADLKRDPATSAGVYMLFHNTKDDEHWLVVPKRFTLNRTADKRVLYEYDIELLVVGPGEDAAEPFISEDKTLLDTMRDGLRMAKSYVDMATGFVNDVTATIGEVERLVKDAGKIIATIGDLADATSNLISGVTDLIESPAALLNTLADSIDRVQNTLVTAVAETQGISSTYVNAWRRVNDSLNRLGIHPELFESEAQKTLRKIRERQETLASTITRALEATAPTSLRGFENRGTEPLPGAANRADAELGVGKGVNRYSGTRGVRVAQGDTLASLAANYLGDARLWQDIALLNGLKPPFLDSQADAVLAGPENPLPGILSIGATIQIPTFSRSPQRYPIATTLGVSAELPFEEQLLGREFRLEPTDARKNVYDWVVDADHGSQDFKTIAGVDNLAQGLTTRLTTQRGHNVLYKRLGLERIVGLNQVDIDAQEARFRIIEAVAADPRVGAVRRIQFIEDEESPDALVTDMDVEVRGFAQGISVQAIGVI